MKNDPITTHAVPRPRNPWVALEAFTAARLALGSTGNAIPTDKLLELKRAHAAARSAVMRPFDPDAIAAGLKQRRLPFLELKTCIHDKQEYLLHPELGRRLDADSAARLKQLGGEYDLAIIVSDGLSPLAAERHFLPLLDAFLPRFAPRTVAPILIVPFGRVGLLNDIGRLMHIKAALILLGERPGMTSPDSLGAYFAWHPDPAQSDADRNCVSNIRPEGLPPVDAAPKLVYLLEKARQEDRSGFLLKDDYVKELNA